MTERAPYVESLNVEFLSNETNIARSHPLVE